MDLIVDPGTGALAAFVLACVLIELTPGPNMAYLAIVAASVGRRPGAAVVAGVALGLASVGILSAFGLASIFTASPVLYALLRYAGVGYLFWLAWEGWREAAADGQDAPAAANLVTAFRRGLVTNLLNPKAAVFYIAVLPGFADPSRPVLAETLKLTAIYVAVATAIHAGIVGLAGTARRWLDDPRRERRVRRVLSLALAATALWLLWKTRV